VAVARPDLDAEDEFADEFDGDEPPAPWHNSTPAVVGASIAGLAVIGILVAAIMYVTRQDSPGAPVDFVDPSFSSAAANTPTTTTTETITSTAPVSTTEINAPTSPSTTSGSSETSSSGSSSSGPVTRPRERQTDESPGAPTSRRPRFNITRTLAPQQAG
jgi:hypothetical protein